MRKFLWDENWCWDAIIMLAIMNRSLFHLSTPCLDARGREGSTTHCQAVPCRSESSLLHSKSDAEFYYRWLHFLDKAQVPELLIRVQNGRMKNLKMSKETIHITYLMHWLRQYFSMWAWTRNRFDRENLVHCHNTNRTLCSFLFFVSVRCQFTILCSQMVTFLKWSQINSIFS